MAQAGSIFINTRLGTAQLAADLAKVRSMIRRSARQFQSLGADMSAAFTLPIGGALAFAAKKTIDFESALTGVAKTTNLSGKELAEFKKQLVGLSREVPTSFEGLASLAEAAGQMGVEKQNLIEFTRTMADLGEATDLAGEEGARDLARFIRATGGATDQARDLGNVIVALGNNFAATEREILDMAGRMAGAGASARISQEGILAMGAALLELGVQSEAGGSAFSRLFSQIETAVVTGNEELSEFARVSGQTAQQFKENFGRSAEETILQFIGGLANIKKEGGSTTLALAELGIEEIRMKGALQLSANAADRFAMALGMAREQIHGGNALANEAAQRYQTLASRLAMLRNDFAATAEVVGQDLRPSMDGIIDAAHGTLAAFRDLSPRMREAGLAFGVTLAVIGPLAAAFGTLALLISAKGALIIGALAGMSAVWAGWGDVIGASLRNIRRRFLLFTSGFDEWVAEMKLKAKLFVADLLDTFANFALKLKDVLPDFLGLGLGDVKAEGAGRELLKGTIESTEAHIKKLREQRAELERTMEVTGSFAEIWDTTGGVAEGAKAKFEDLIQKLTGGGGGGGGAGGGGKGSLSDAAKNATTAVEGLGKALAGTLRSNAGDSLKDQFQKALEKGAFDSAAKIADSIGASVEEGVLAGHADAIAEAAKGGGAFEKAARALAEADAKAQVAATKKALEGEIADARKKAAEDEVAFWTDAFQNAITGETFDFSDALKRFGVGLAAEIAAALTDIDVKSVQDLGKKIGGALSDALKDVFSGANLGDTFNQFAKNIASSLEAAAVPALLNVVSQFVQAFKTGGSSSFTGFNGPQVIVDALGDLGDDLFGGGKSSEQQARDQIRNALAEVLGGRGFTDVRGAFNQGLFEGASAGSFQTDLAAQVHEFVKPLADVIQQFQDFDFDVVMANVFGGATGEVESLSEALLNMNRFMEQSGYTTEKLKESFAQAFLAGKIGIEEFMAALQTINKVAEGAFQSIDEAVGLMAEELGPDGSPQLALDSLAGAFQVAEREGKDAFQAVRDYIVNRWGEDAGQEFDRVKAAGIESFEDFKNLSADQIALLFDVITSFADEMSGELERGARQGADASISQLQRIIDKANDAIAATEAATEAANSAPTPPPPSSGDRTGRGAGITVNVNASGADANQIDARVKRAVQAMEGAIVARTVRVINSQARR